MLPANLMPGKALQGKTCAARIDHPLPSQHGSCAAMLHQAPAQDQPARRTLILSATVSQIRVPGWQQGQGGAPTDSTPQVTSLWPPMNLVPEIMLMSAPSSSGRWNMGDMKLLSTRQMAPAAWAISASALMSHTCGSHVAAAR